VNGLSGDDRRHRSSPEMNPPDRRIESARDGSSTSRWRASITRSSADAGDGVLRSPEYQMGDDIRTMTGMSPPDGASHVKKFVEERELTVALVVDALGSRDWQRQPHEGEMAARCRPARLFRHQEQRPCSGCSSSPTIEKFVPARKGRKHVLRVIRELLYAAPESRGTDIAGALDYAMKVFSRRSVHVPDLRLSSRRVPARRCAARRNVTTWSPS